MLEIKNGRVQCPVLVIDRLKAGSLTSSIRRRSSQSIIKIEETMARRRRTRQVTLAPRESQHIALLRTNIKDMLVRLRKAAGLTNKQLCEKLQVLPSTICRLESGKNTPSIPMIDAYFRACGYELMMTAEKLNGVNQSSPTSTSSSNT